MNKAFHQICDSVLEHEKQYSFRKARLNIKIEGVKEVVLLRKNNLLINVGIVMLHIDPQFKDINYAKLCKQIKFRIAFKVLFIPLFYAFFHQFIIVDEDVIEEDSYFKLGDSIDSIDNQISITQSITLVDSYRKKYIHVRTWGQVISGKFQNAIVKSLQNSSYTDNEATDYR